MIPKNDNISFYYKLKALHKFVGNSQSTAGITRKLITGWKKPLEKVGTRNLWIRFDVQQKQQTVLFFQGARVYSGKAYLHCTHESSLEPSTTRNYNDGKSFLTAEL